MPAGLDHLHLERGSCRGTDWRELLTFTVAWPVSPGATVTVPKELSVDSGGERLARSTGTLEAAQLGPLALVMLRSNGTVAPATCGPLIAGVSFTTGGWWMHVSSLMTSAGAASVFSQTESTIPLSTRPLASLPMKIGPRARRDLPAARVFATAAPST